MSTSSQRAGAAQADDLFCPASAIPQAMANHTNTYFGPGGILSKMESVADIYPVGQSLLRRGDRLNYYIALACVLLVAYFFRSKREKHVEAPFFKAGKLKWIFDAENQIRASYNKFYNKVYQIKATEGLQVLIPPSLVGELKGLPEDVLSAQEAVREALMSNYTKFSPGENSELLSALVRTKLTHNLARLVPQLKDELEYITATELSECKDWTPVKLQPFALRTIARLSGRAFVGPSLNRNEEWMQTSIKYAIDVFLSVVELQFFPTWMRSVAQHIVPHIRKTRRNVARARALLQPILEERVRDMDAPGFEAPDDLLQWVLGSLPEERRTDYQAQTELQLILSAASIHTTNSLLVDCFFDLAAETDVQEELRQEVLEVVADDDEWSKKDCIPRLKKLDSFIKEVQRTSGNITSFIRKVIKPITLSDGTYLPAGTKLLAPQTGISHDARYFPEPERFDALRFYRLRQQSDDDANRHQLTSLSDVNLNFGAGKHACPGRFFAGNEIKLVLAYFLLHYDMKLRDGQDRPRPVMMMMTKTPNPNVEIEFRRRSSVE